MTDQQDETVLTDTNARQGRPKSMARHALMYGLGLVILAFVIIYFVMAHHSFH